MTTHKQNDLSLQVDDRDDAKVRMRNNQLIQTHFNNQLSYSPWTFTEHDPDTDYVTLNGIDTAQPFDDFTLIPETWNTLGQAPRINKEHRWSCLTVNMGISYRVQTQSSPSTRITFRMRVVTEAGTESFLCADVSTTNVDDRNFFQMSTGQIDTIGGRQFNGDVQLLPEVANPYAANNASTIYQNVADIITIQVLEHPPVPRIVG